MFEKIVALDLGGLTGWACVANNVITCGTENFKSTRFESSGMKFYKFKKWLTEKIETDKPEIIVFEQVQRHVATIAAQTYGAYLGVLQSTCEARQLPYQGFNVSTIKITATGKGNADKFQVIAAAKKKWPDLSITDDNTADALWLLETAQKAL